MIELKELTLLVRDTIKSILSGKDATATQPYSNLVEKYRVEETLLAELERFDRIDPKAGYRRFLKAVTPGRRRRVLLRLTAASAAAALIVAAIFSLNFQREEVRLQAAAMEKPAPPAVTVLRMGDSTLSVEGDIVMTDNAIAIRGENIDTQTASPDPANQSNTLITPKGKTQRIELCDGTAVWLNSDSRLTFPTRFGTDRRLVALEGEAYFEVRQSAVPFIVKTPATEVRVLGTTFNLSAYTDDGDTELSLYEGSVALTTAINATTIFPGTTVAANNSTGYIAPPSPLTGGAPGWITGKFDFRAVPITKLCKVLERWYGVQCRVDPLVSNHAVTIVVSATASLSDIVNLINGTCGVHMEYDEMSKILTVTLM